MATQFQGINVGQDVISPFDRVQMGLAQGAQVRQQQLAAQELAQAQQEISMMARQGGDVSAVQLTDVMARYPNASAKLKAPLDSLNEQQRQSQINFGNQVYSALEQNSPQVAIELMNRRAQAMENSGDIAQAKEIRSIAQMAEIRPSLAKQTIGMNLAGLQGKEFANNFAAFAKIPGEVAQTEAQTKKLGAETLKLGAEVAKLGAETAAIPGEARRKSLELPAGSLQVVNDAVASATSSAGTATRLNSLATNLENELTKGTTSGALGTGIEAYKKFFGDQDAKSVLLAEYTQLKNTAALSMLPKGPASDRDVALVLGGFLPDTANPKTLASFVRGMAKIQNYNSAIENAKSEWVSQNRTLGRSTDDIEVYGVQVPAGTNFSQFVTKNIEKIANAKQKTDQIQAVKGRSYMRFAQ